MAREGAGLVAASTSEALARTLAEVFERAGVVCEVSSDPVGVELAGAAKNAAALAAGATEAQGLNAAGAAAGHIFAEVWHFAATRGARPESMIGLAGTGDLVATALAPQSRNRRAGELLAQGVPTAEIPERIGQAIEALESVPLLARALDRAAIDAPVTSGLARLISGELPLDEWVELVRTTVPLPARRRVGVRVQPGFWRGLWRRFRGFFTTLTVCDFFPVELVKVVVIRSRLSLPLRILRSTASALRPVTLNVTFTGFLFVMCLRSVPTRTYLMAAARPLPFPGLGLKASNVQLALPGASVN